MVGIGGIGSGIFFALEGSHTLGRDESRVGRLLDVRDYCKLHIVSHYVARLLGAAPQGDFRVIPVGKVGNDAPGRQMVQEMNEAGMDTSHVQVVAGSPTLFSVCFQYPDGTGGNITTSNSAAATLSNTDLERVEKLFSEPAIALAVPEVPLETRAYFLEMAGRHGAFRAASFTAAEVVPALHMGMFANLDVVSLNEGEAAMLAGRVFDSNDPGPFLRACEAKLKADCPQLRLTLTAGKHGAFGYCGGMWDFCPAPEVEVASTAGAGDALLAGLIAGAAAGVPFLRDNASLKRGSGEPLASALDMAVLLASYTVTSPHTIHPRACIEELLRFAVGLGLDLDPALRGALEPVSAGS